MKYKNNQLMEIAYVSFLIISIFLNLINVCFDLDFIEWKKIVVGVTINSYFLTLIIIINSFIDIRKNLIINYKEYNNGIIEVEKAFLSKREENEKSINEKKELVSKAIDVSILELNDIKKKNNNIIKKSEKYNLIMLEFVRVLKIIGFLSFFIIGFYKNNVIESELLLEIITVFAFSFPILVEIIKNLVVNYENNNFLKSKKMVNKLKLKVETLNVN